jgi:hypothetical protein
MAFLLDYVYYRRGKSEEDANLLLLLTNASISSEDKKANNGMATSEPEMEVLSSFPLFHNKSSTNQILHSLPVYRSSLKDFMLSKLVFTY